MALPCLKTWQSLADFKYPESSVEYKPPTINVADLSGIPPQLLKIHKFQKENNTPSHGLSSLRQILNTQCGLMRYQAAKDSAFSSVSINKKYLFQPGRALPLLVQ